VQNSAISPIDSAVRYITCEFNTTEFNLGETKIIVYNLGKVRFIMKEI